MREHRSLFRFPVAFLLVLALLLAVSLDVVRLLHGEATPVGGPTIPSRLQADLVAAVYFLVLSGYSILFLIAYFVFTRKASRRTRVSINVLWFSASCLVFYLFVGESFSTLDGVLLAAGLISVLASDFIAERLDRLGKASSIDRRQPRQDAL